MTYSLDPRFIYTKSIFLSGGQVHLGPFRFPLYADWHVSRELSADLGTQWSSLSSCDVDVPNPRLLLHLRIVFSKLDPELNTHFTLIWRWTELSPEPSPATTMSRSVGKHFSSGSPVSSTVISQVSRHSTLPRYGLVEFLQWLLLPVTLPCRSS